MFILLFCYCHFLSFIGISPSLGHFCLYSDSALSVFVPIIGIAISSNCSAITAISGVIFPRQGSVFPLMAVDFFAHRSYKSPFL